MHRHPSVHSSFSQLGTSHYLSPEGVEGGGGGGGFGAKQGEILMLLHWSDSP